MADTEDPGRLRRILTHPALLILLLAPFFGEGLSGATAPLDLLLPWNLAFMAALYGCGALVCREVAHRFDLGFGGLVVLGIAYGVWEEGLVDRYWFSPSFWADTGVGTYGVVRDTNVLLAVHLTVFHTAISICASVLVVEWLTPRRRHRPWVARPGLLLAGLVLALTPVIYGEFDKRPPTPVLVATGALFAALVATAFLVGRARSRPVSPEPTTTRPPRRGLGVLAFTCVLAHWITTYTVAETALAWPIGVALALLPVAVGVLLIPRRSVTDAYGSDGVRVVVGLLTFFVILDVFVGLLGRYDMVVGAAVTGHAVRRLYLRRATLGSHPLTRAPATTPPSIE